jgi:hypothetical protein
MKGDLFGLFGLLDTAGMIRLADMRRRIHVI